MDLFISEPELQFERPKTASTQLDENPNNWGRQVLVELYRTLPQSSEYSPQVMFMKTDREQGTGFGVIVVTNDTDSALSAVRPGSSAPKAFVPLVVKSHMLCPLDLLMTKNGRFLPLNEHRLREVLFRPETFDMVTDDWGDTTLYNMFYPPGRSDNDFGSGMSQSTGGGVTMIQGPGMKLSADAYSMLSGIAGTLLAPDITRVSRTMETTPGLIKAAQENPVFLYGLKILGEAQASAVSDASALVKAAAESGTPDVLQIGWSATEDEYWVKSASRGCYFNRVPRYMSRAQFLKYAGEDVTRKVDTEGTVTIAGAVASPGEVDPNASTWGVVTETGIYKVKTMAGKEMVGWVLPQLLDTEGNLSPMAVFHNGAVASVQDQIAGSRVATGADLPAAPAKGTGLFYCGGATPAGTVPLEVLGAEGEMGGGKSYLVRTLTGEDTKVRLVPGLQRLMAKGGEYFAPEAVKFMPLDEEGAVPLVETVDQLSKTAAETLAPMIRIWGDGDVFNVRFRNTPKLASVSSSVLNKEEAVFTLCLAGLDASTAQNKVAAASKGYGIDITARDVELASVLTAEAHKTASVRSQEALALRRHLVKEAAVLPDVMTVDSVLSLGFINTENVRMFIARLPYLEKALHQVCELLLASRIGLSEIPEYATARAIRGLDDTVQGLKALMLRKVEEGEVG